jgi:hypothetical protein
VNPLASRSVPFNVSAPSLTWQRAQCASKLIGSNFT